MEIYVCMYVCRYYYTQKQKHDCWPFSIMQKWFSYVYKLVEQSDPVLILLEKISLNYIALHHIALLNWQCVHVCTVSVHVTNTGKRLFCFIFDIYTLLRFSIRENSKWQCQCSYQDSNNTTVMKWTRLHSLYITSMIHSIKYWGVMKNVHMNKNTTNRSFMASLRQFDPSNTNKNSLNKNFKY